jgi:hypothetical protein
MQMRTLLAALCAMHLMSGCGRLDRWFAGVTGGASESCMRGVLYYQFTSGAAPAYKPDGSLITCS